MIKVEGLGKSFRSGRGQVQALSGISFQLEEGRRLAILGKSGSGKSTLLNCLGGLERPDQGDVWCAGLRLAELSPGALAAFQRRHVGFVFQFGNLLSYLTVEENLTLPLAMNGMEGRARADRIGELLESVGLSGIGRAMPRELSGGEVQRVAFARAIAHKPRLLLADEPTASLDSGNGGQLVELMFDLTRRSGCTIVLATHDQDVMAFADDVIRLRDGHLEVMP